MKYKYLLVAFLSFLSLVSFAQEKERVVSWDANGLMLDGKRVMPVMGEIHYSRVPVEEWDREVMKMKEGGVTMIACYVFWNHIEEVEGQFDWQEQRNLHNFLLVCKKYNMPVILRIGPFCHGEVRNGGIPDWVFLKNCKMRSEDPVFLSLVKTLYAQIFSQVKGLQWKDGGPVIAAQFDNEYHGYASYLLSLKKIAKEVGFDLPFYTRTGWPELKSAVPFGELIPLYGDYADGFWDRAITDPTGDYWQAFHFHPSRANKSIGSEQIDYSHNVSASTQKVLLYPYFTCELGGGMMTSYHRRIFIYPQDAYSLAVVKLGSGSNLLGYYMYHGGTNPESRTGMYLNETQRTIATNYNDLPVKTYDFQAPLGEFGQINPHYYLLRKLHLFMLDFGGLLAPMMPVFPDSTVFRQGDDTRLRWSYRHNGNAAFVFVNNYERLQPLTAKTDVTFHVCGVTFPQRPLVIPAGMSAIFPVNLKLGNVKLKYATAQLLAKQKGRKGNESYYFFQVKGIPAEFSVNGKLLQNVLPKGERIPVFHYGKTSFYLLTDSAAGRFRLNPSVEEYDYQGKKEIVGFRMQKEGLPSRHISIGVNKVAEEPVDSDFTHASVYSIDLKSILNKNLRQTGLLDIDYHGDCARLYANGKLIDDNFYNGRHFLYGLWRLPENVATLTLYVLPIQENMPVYFPVEADKAPGQKVNSIIVRGLGR